jgi:hypothetical protein
MIVSGSIVADAKWWGISELAGSADPGERLTRVDDVVDLLAESTSPAAQPMARIVLEEMGTGLWRVIRGAHRSPGDGTWHVLVDVGGKRYHLRLDGQDCVFDITRMVGDVLYRPGGRPPPWTPPGA